MGRWASADFPHLPITSYSGVHIFLLCALEAVFLLCSMATGVAKGKRSTSSAVSGTST